MIISPKSCHSLTVAFSFLIIINDYSILKIMFCLSPNEQSLVNNIKQYMD